MLWLVFFIAVFFNGIILAEIIFPDTHKAVKYAAIYAFGSFFSVSSMYLLTAYVFKKIDIAFIIFLFLSFLFWITIGKKYFSSIPSRLSLTKKQYFFIICILLFSLYIFSKSFGYDIKHGNFLLATNVYADFGIHIPFIRSFSIGNNFPAEVPVFGNKHLLYHFMVDFYAGTLEHFGLRIDYAFNIVSSFAFTSLMLVIYAFAVLIFKSRAVGLLSVFLFLCPNTFSLIDFFQNTSFSSFISFFWHNTTYYTNGPLGKDTIAVYWYLNTFLNQRSLTFGILFLMLFMYYLFSQKQKYEYVSIIFFGIIGGLFPLWNTPLFIGLEALLCACILFLPAVRKQSFLILILSLVIAIPFTYLISAGSKNAILLNPGFLLAGKLTIQNFLIFWQWNLGIMIWLSLAGFFFADKQQKTIFFIFLVLFLIPNILQISQDIASSHKLINVWLIAINMYGSYALVQIYKKSIMGKIVTTVCCLFILFSGLLNILVIKNDILASIPDYSHNSLMKWAVINIPKNAFFLTNGEIYDPISLTGRKIFLGREYYIISYGGDVIERSIQKNSMLKGSNTLEVKNLLKRNNISYVVIYKNNFAKNEQIANKEFYQKNYKNIYEDQYGSIFKI